MSKIDWAGRVTPYPAETVARYRGAGAWGSLPIAAEFRAVAERMPDREAVVAPDGRLTFGELDHQADRLALGLVELGLRPGQAVVLQVSNRLLTIVAWYGLLKAGLIPVCALTAHRAHEIGAISRKTGAVAHLAEAGTGNFDLVAFARQQRVGHPTSRYVLTLGASAAAQASGAQLRVEDLIEQADAAVARKVVDSIQAQIDPDEVAVFQLSGGTTGVPKIIPRLHAEYWYNARAYAAGIGLEPDDSQRPPDPRRPQCRDRLRRPRAAQRRRLPPADLRRPRPGAAHAGGRASDRRAFRSRPLRRRQASRLLRPDTEPAAGCALRGEGPATDLRSP